MCKEKEETGKNKIAVWFDNHKDLGWKVLPLLTLGVGYKIGGRMADKQADKGLWILTRFGRLKWFDKNGVELVDPKEIVNMVKNFPK